jgi:glycosyltransferase involved in cell wall biosynthesis
MIAPAQKQQARQPEAARQRLAEAPARPRVLMVGPHRTKTLGGISTLIDEMLRSHLAADFDFLAIASHQDGLSKLGKFWLALVALARFARALVTWQPDLVYVHIGGNASLYRKIPFITLARWCGRTVLAHFHAGDFGPFFARQSWWGRKLIVRGIGQSNRLLTVSRELGNLLHQLLPEAEVSVVPNGVETALFAGRGESHPGAARSGGPFVRLLFAGTMGRLKGERDLIRAVQRVAGAHPELRLVLLGRGAETIAPLCREAGLWHAIDHLGPVPLSERAAFFKQSDMFVLPTYAEGMPMVVLEAMAAGLPVISTPVGGIPELIEDGIEGYLVAPGDVDALAERITRLLTDSVERRRMGARAQTRAAEFDWSVILDRLGRELHQAVDQRQPRPITAANPQPEAMAASSVARAKRAVKE